MRQACGALGLSGVGLLPDFSQEQHAMASHKLSQGIRQVLCITQVHAPWRPAFSQGAGQMRQSVGSASPRALNAARSSPACKTNDGMIAATSAALAALSVCNGVLRLLRKTIQASTSASRPRSAPVPHQVTKAHGIHALIQPRMWLTKALTSAAARIDTPYCFARSAMRGSTGRADKSRLSAMEPPICFESWASL